MTRFALLVAAVALLCAPVAEAKPTRFAAKKAAPAKCKKKRPCARGWRALPTAPAAPAPLSAPAALPAPSDEVAGATPVQPAGEVVAPPPPPPPPSAPLCDPSPWLGVTAEDVDGVFRFRLTRRCVPAGTILFQFRNIDLAEHNLWAEGVAPAAAQRRLVADTPGETTVTASAQLPAGQWRLFCSFDGHETMSRLVDVTPAG